MLKKMAFPKAYYMAVVLVMCKMVCDANAKRCTSERSVFGMMLQRHIFKRIMGASLGHVCFQECNADVRCQSFNYVYIRACLWVEQSHQRGQTRGFCSKLWQVLFSRTQEQRWVIWIVSCFRTMSDQKNWTLSELKRKSFFSLFFNFKDQSSSQI